MEDDSFFYKWLHLSKLTGAVITLVVTFLSLAFFHLLGGEALLMAVIPTVPVRMLVFVGVILLFAGVIFGLTMVPGLIARNREKAPGYYYRPSLGRRFFLLLLALKSLLRIK